MVTTHLEAKDLEAVNTRTLRLRKLEYKRDLTSLFERAGYIFIIVLYLKNMSFVRCVVRLLLHMVLSNPFPSTIPTAVPPHMKRQLTRSFLWAMTTISILWLGIDMIVGVPATANESGYFHGSLTLQVIGEQSPQSRWVYVYYNALITATQLITIYLSCLLRTDDDIPQHACVLPGSNFSLNQIEGDGYSGQAIVCSVHPLQIYKTIMAFTDDEPTEGTSANYNDYMGDRFGFQQGMF